jgi:Flp pilus assembly pilin Flp
MSSPAKQFIRGAAASEYAISLAFIAAAIALALSLFDLKEIFPALVSKIAGLIE